MHTTWEHTPFQSFRPSPPQLLQFKTLNRISKTELLKFEIDNDGQPRLRATQHVGVLRLANTTLQILPKIFRADDGQSTQEHEHQATRNLLTMLAYTHDLPLLHHAAPLAHQSHDWLELLTRLFATNLRAQLHAGPHRTYQSFDDDLPLLRGKLRIADQLRRPDRQHRFACTFDEFSIDNPLNRIFRFVIERLFFQTRSHPNRQLLSELRTLLEDVPLPTRCTPTDADPSRLITHLNHRYRPSLELARMFLSDATPQLTTGPTETINFLFDMNDLFEKFTANFLKKHREEILPPDSHLNDCKIRVQSPIKALAIEADNSKHFRLKPDVVFTTKDRAHPLIIDTKYKRLDPDAPRYGISPADFYQMLAYAHRYRCPEVLLLYPRTAELRAAWRKTFHIPGSQTRITAATIDITVDLTKTIARDAFIQEFRSIILYLTQPIPINATKAETD